MTEQKTSVNFDTPESNIKILDKSTLKIVGNIVGAVVCLAVAGALALKGDFGPALLFLAAGLLIMPS